MFIPRFGMKDSISKFLDFLSGASRKFEMEGIKVDFDKKQIIIPKEWTIHFEGNASLSSEKHFMIDSGATKEKEPRADRGYGWALWLNCTKDGKGQPLRDDIEYPDVEEHTSDHAGGCNCNKKEK